MSCKGSTRFNAPALLLVGACRTKCSCCQQSFCNTAFSCLPVPRPLSTPTLGGTHLECLAACSGCSCRCCRRRCSQVRLPAMSATQQQCGHSTAHSTCQNRSTSQNTAHARVQHMPECRMWQTTAHDRVHHTGEQHMVNTARTGCVGQCLAAQQYMYSTAQLPHITA